MNESQKDTPQAMGRPRALPEWRKTTVILLESQIEFLDDLEYRTLKNTKVKLSRSEFIRSLIAILQESGVDLSNAASEEEIKNALRASFLPPAE